MGGCWHLPAGHFGGCAPFIIMSDHSRLLKLAGHLQAEIRAARAGDSSGQFPILDLLGNLRDEAGAHTDLSPLVTLCVDAWERMVRIVESGQPFAAADISWLQDLLSQTQALAGWGDSAIAAPAPAGLPATATEPAANLVTAATAAEEAGLPAEEAPLLLNLAADADLLREFINESREHLDNIEQGVLVLEHAPDDAERLNTIFRAFHTFKGGAGFLNLVPVNRLAHVLESLLDLARQGRLAIDAPVIELILRGRDVLKKFLDEIEGQLAGSRPVIPITIPTAVLKAEVQEVIEGKPHAPDKTAAEPATVRAAPTENTSSVNAAVDSAGESSRAQLPAQATMVKVDTGKLDGLLDLVGEMVIAQSLVG